MDKTAESKEKSSFMKAFSLAWELGYAIVIPLVALAVLGRLLDKKYDSSPILLLAGMFLALTISGMLVFKKTKKILEELGKK